MRTGRLSTIVAFVLALLVPFDSSAAQPPAGDVPRVRIDAAPGPYLVGQGIELRVALVARDQRPKLELPRLNDARLGIIDTSLKPISVSSVGPNVRGENLFLTRLRLVPRAPGTLVVPAIIARLGNREGRSKPLRLSIENPPLAGRTSSFLGGIGGFSAEAEADVARTRVGQEFLYRIRISGPAAWGMTIRPDLGRLLALPIEARVETLGDETVDEPPARTFVFRVRPMRPGKVVLPPVSIASFDPSVKRYLTRVTGGVPITVVAAPAFDESTLDYQPEAEGPGRRILIATACVAGLAAVAAVAVLVGRRLQMRWVESCRSGPTAARRFARGAAHRLKPTADGTRAEIARRALEALVEYARLSVGRPPGALTPDEARAAIAQGSGSDELGRTAARLAARCDRLVFAADAGEASGENEAAPLAGDARDLFTALGRSGRGDWKMRIWRKSLGKVSEPQDATTARRPC